MPAINEKSSETREIAATRVFDAPRATVFKAWIDPTQLARWWGPKYFSNPVCELDVRPGGAIRVDMRGPDGTVYPMGGVFHEIVEPERLVFTTTAMHDDQGKPALEVLNTATFVERNGKTTMTLNAVIMKAAPEAAGALAGMRQGWTQSLEKLAEDLGPERPFVVARVFDAPRDVVFDVWTDCKHIVHWWGPKSFTVSSCKIDLRPGGVFHYGLRGPDGSEIWGKWIYREIVKPERLVVIASFSDPEGGVTRHPMAPDWPRETFCTITFEEWNGKTLVSVRWSPYNASEAEKNLFDNSYDNMQQGWGGTFEQLRDYVAKATS